MQQSIASVFAVLTLASVASAQCPDATSATMGAPCGTATLDSTLPILGGTSTLIIDGTAPSVPGILFLSPNTGGSFMFMGCEIFLSKFNTLANFTTDVNGDADITTTVPSDTALCGVETVLQAVVLSGTGPVTALGLEVTNAVVILFGTS